MKNTEVNKIDITNRVIKVRAEQQKKENDILASMSLPSWMQTPFDEYFSEDMSKTSTNVVNVDFSAPSINIPKKLAASNIESQLQYWYDQGVVAFKDTSGAILNIIFNKVSHSDSIEITVTVTDGDYSLLQKYSGMSNIGCSLFDSTTELASLTAAVNHNGTFMHAEGIIKQGTEPTDGNDFISLRFYDKH